MAYVSYTQRGKKQLWSYNIREGNKSLQYKGGFKTKREAKLEAEKVLHRLKTGSTLRTDMTLPELYQEWLDLKILPSDRSDVTKSKYLMRKNVIIRLFGDRKISKINPSEYQRIMNEYGKKVSRKHLGRLNSNIKSSIHMAIADKIIIEDFTAYVELFSSKQGQETEEKYLHTEKDYQTVLIYSKAKFDYQNSIVPYIIFFLFKTGMRFAELVGLTWEEIDFEKEEIRTYRRYNTATHQFTGPKNKTSVRSIPITADMLKVFAFLKKMQEKTNKELGITNQNNLVFQHFGYVHGMPDIATVNKAMKIMLTELDISPIITTKGARHTYGSVKVQEGVPLEVLARWFGHKDTSMLRSIYIHLLDETRNEWFEREKISGGQIGGQTAK